jgi:hypothetical protein
VRISAWGFAALFLFSLLTGCGNKQNTVSSSAKAEQPEQVSMEQVLIESASDSGGLTEGELTVTELAVQEQDLPASVSSGAEASEVPAGSSAPPWLGREAPAGAFWGTGSARQNLEQFSRTMAEARAREDLAAKINKFIRREKAGDGEKTGDIRSVHLEGARAIEWWHAPDGTWWCLVELSGADAENALGTFF